MGRFLAIILCLAGAVYAAPNRMRVHANTSLQIHGIGEGPSGFLWLATTEGVYRFDGFHYQKIEEYPFRSALTLGFSSDGSLWVGDYQGLARMRGGRWQVVINEEVHGLAVYPDRVLVRRRRQVVQVDLSGSIKELPLMPRRDLSIDSAGRLWAVCMNPVRVCSMDPAISSPPVSFDAATVNQALADSQNRIWVANDEHAELASGGIHLARRPAAVTDRPGPLFTGRGGHTWFLGETIRDLSSNFEFRDRADNARYSPLAGYEDRRGHLWVASVGRGLVEWIPDAKWERWFPEDLAGEPAVQIIRDSSGLVLVTHKNLYRLSGDRWIPICRDERRYDSAIALDGGGFLASIRGFGVARLDTQGRIVERLIDPATSLQFYRKVGRDAQGRLWVTSKRVLFQVEGPPGHMRLREIPMPAMRADEIQEPVDLQIGSDGSLWTGYQAGLARFDQDGRWNRIETDAPLTTVRSFGLGPDEIWVAFRRLGPFSRLQKSGAIWHVTDFANEPRSTYFLKRDSRGWIWRGTPDGVFISDGKNTTDWLHLNLASGLAANELDIYGFFEDSDGSVWIAGEEGVTHLHPEGSWFAAPQGAPKLTRLEADGRMLPEGGPVPSETKTLRIEFGSLDVNPFRDAPMRYRVENDWQESSNGTIELHDLKSRDYKLELAYTGTGSGSSSVYKIRVGSIVPVPMWSWLVGFFLPAAAIGSLAFDKIRFRAQKAMFLLRRRYQHGASEVVPNDWVGETLAGRYALDRIVSRGGFSVVYAGRDLNRENWPVAVKVLNHVTDDRWVRDRFAHELSALRSIDHPGVIRVLDSWISSDGEPCIAMPFLNGPTLRDELRSGPIDPERAAGFIRKIGEALAAVHARGIVHRDFKPENVILMADQPVLIDFGSAGLRTAENELAETQLMAGSFHYMAPERLMRRYSPASDVFSFGIVVLEMLTGKRLGDLKSMFADESFIPELSALLGNEDAAEKLAPAFDPEPRRRPGPVDAWANLIAAAILRRSVPGD